MNIHVLHKKYVTLCPIMLHTQFSLNRSIFKVLLTRIFLILCCLYLVYGEETIFSQAILSCSWSWQFLWYLCQLSRCWTWLVVGQSLLCPPPALLCSASWSPRPFPLHTSYMSEVVEIRYSTECPQKVNLQFQRLEKSDLSRGINRQTAKNWVNMYGLSGGFLDENR